MRCSPPWLDVTEMCYCAWTQVCDWPFAVVIFDLLLLMYVIEWDEMADYVCRLKGGQAAMDQKLHFRLCSWMISWYDAGRLLHCTNFPWRTINTTCEIVPLTETCTPCLPADGWNTSTLMENSQERAAGINTHRLISSRGGRWTRLIVTSWQRRLNVT